MLTEGTDSRISDDDVVKLGSLISGVVDSFTPRGIIIFVNAKSHSKGTIPIEHLADHHGLFLLLTFCPFFCLVV